MKSLEHILLKSGGLLAGPLAKAKVLNHCQQSLHKFLDEECYSQVIVSNLENGHLYLITSSSTWGMRIRILIPELLTQFQTHLPELELKKITVRVGITRQLITISSRKADKAKLSQASADVIRETAVSLSDDKLRNVLLKISSHC